MGWLIALAVLIVILLIPVGVHVLYDTKGFYLNLVLGPVKILLFPAKKKAKKEKKKDHTKQKKAAPKDQKKEKKSGGSIGDFLPIVGTALSFLNAFRKKLRIDDLEVLLILGGSDPCDLSIQYGRGWAILGNVQPLVEQIFLIKKRQVITLVLFHNYYKILLLQVIHNFCNIYFLLLILLNPLIRYLIF